MEVVMLSLFLAAAFAQDGEEGAMEDVACMPLQMTRSVPANGAVGVPVDATFAVIFEGNCGGSTDWVLSIVNPADETVLASAPWTWDGGLPAYASLDPETDLPANTALELRAEGGSGSYYYYGNTVAFTTGDGVVQGTSGTLTATVDAANWYEDSLQAQVELAITPADDPDNLSMIRIVGGNTQMYYTLDQLSFAEIWFGQAAEPEELCAQVSQIDGHGVESEPVTACGPATVIKSGGGLGSGRGCGGSRDVAVTTEPAEATEPVEGLLVLGGFGLLLRRRRR